MWRERLKTSRKRIRGTVRMGSKAERQEGTANEGREWYGLGTTYCTPSRVKDACA